MELPFQSPRQGETCYLSSIADILRYYGANWDESAILISVAGLDIVTEYVENELRIRCSDISLDLEQYCIFFDKIGITIQEFNYKEECSEDSLEMYLKEGFPVLACVDVYWLSYHPEYHKKHEAHVVTIFGIDKDKHIVSISDGYVSTTERSVFYGKIQYEVSIMDMKDCLPMRNLFWVLKPYGEKIINQDSYDIESEILKDTERFILQKNPDKNLFAIRELNTYILKFADEENKPKREQLYQLYLMLTTLCGPVASRKLIAVYFSEIDDKSGRYNEVMEKYNTLSHYWAVVAKLILKLYMTERIKYIERISQRLIEIEKEEMKMATRIIELISEQK